MVVVVISIAIVVVTPWPDWGQQNSC